MYSCGLDVGELLEIKLNDVISKNESPYIIVRNSKGIEQRRAFLSKRVILILTDYFKEYRPTSWLIFGQKDKSKKYTSSSIRKIFKKKVLEMNLNPLLNLRVFRYSYVKHLNLLGIPLIKILNYLKIDHYDSHIQWSKLLHKEYKIDFTPYDKLINESVINESFDDLESLVFELKDVDEIDYLLEGVDCFRNGLLRAGVIFIWSGVIRNIRKQIINNATLKEINEELSSIDSRAKKIKNIDSFEYIKDETTIHLSERIGIFSKFEKNELINNCLGLRNKCGHPSNYKPKNQKVKSFIEEVLNMVYKKTLPNSVHKKLLISN